MPNWCENRMTITAASNADLIALQEKLAFVRAGEVQNSFVDDYGNAMVPYMIRFIFSFSSFLPRPADVEDWYAWSVANWGTKWDVDIVDGRDSDYGDAGQFTISLSGRSMELYYHTAWSPPLEAMKKLSELDLVETVELLYHEPGMGFVGRVVYEDGEEMDSMYSEEPNVIKEYAYEWFGFEYDEDEDFEEDTPEEEAVLEPDTDDDIDWDEEQSADFSDLLRTPPPSHTVDDDKL